MHFKRLNKNLLIIACLLLTNNIFGQLTIGINSSIGTSMINETYPRNGFANLDEKIGISGELGMFISYPISKKLSIGSGLNVNLIRANESQHRDYYGSPGDGIIAYSDYVGFKYAYYLSLPVSLEIDLNKFRLDFGIQTSFNIASGGKTSTEMVSNVGMDGVEPSIRINKSSINRSEYQNIDFGAKVGLNYLLSKKVSLKLFFYHGIYNIKSKRRGLIVWRIKQLAVGVAYKLGEEKKKRRKRKKRS